VALVVTLTMAAAPAPAATPCTSPPSVFPVGQIVPGMTGTGRTVVSGTAPVDFDVEVLGVLPDGIAPGIDLILVRITGPQSFLDQTHGIAAGMSGSPVYIQGQLAGAISFGLQLADHTVGGMTPAQPMVDLFTYPSGPPPSAVPRLARRIVLPPGLAGTVARAARLPLAARTLTAVPLSTPVGVSGLSDRRLGQLQAMLDEWTSAISPSWSTGPARHPDRPRRSSPRRSRAAGTSSPWSPTATSPSPASGRPRRPAGT